MIRIAITFFLLGYSYSSSTDEKCGDSPVLSVSGVQTASKLQLAVGEKPWHDRDYAFDTIPTYLTGGFFQQLPHKDIAMGTVISISITKPAVVYLVFETGNVINRDGGFGNSLPGDGWSPVDGSLNHWLNTIYYKDVAVPMTIQLPATTTGHTVMTVVVKEICMADCLNPTTKHGQTQEVTRYDNEVVNAPDLCSSEVRTRTCDDGTWGQWSGSYTYEQCVVNQMCSGNVVHGTIQTRTRYDMPEVNAPTVCTSQTQTRTCSDGVFSVWSGSYTYDQCVVNQGCDGNVVHGTVQTRTRYNMPEVNAPTVCTSETQTRTCSDGIFSGWSGSYTYENCIQKIDPCPPAKTFAGGHNWVAGKFGNAYVNLYDSSTDSPRFDSRGLSFYAHVKRSNTFHRYERLFDFGDGAWSKNIFAALDVTSQGGHGGNREGTLEFRHIYANGNCDISPDLCTKLDVPDFLRLGEEAEVLLTIDDQGRMEAWKKPLGGNWNLEGYTHDRDGNMVDIYLPNPLNRYVHPIPDATRSRLYIGKDNWDHGQTFDGDMEDIRVWQCAINPSAITSTTTAGPPTPSTTSPPPTAAKFLLMVEGFHGSPYDAVSDEAKNQKAVIVDHVDYVLNRLKNGERR